VAGLSIELERIFNLTMNLLAYSGARPEGGECPIRKKLIDECFELVASAANEKGGLMVISDCEGDVRRFAGPGWNASGAG